MHSNIYMKNIFSFLFIIKIIPFITKIIILIIKIIILIINILIITPF